MAFIADPFSLAITRREAGGSALRHTASHFRRSVSSPELACTPPPNNAQGISPQTCTGPTTIPTVRPTIRPSPTPTPTVQPTPTPTPTPTPPGSTPAPVPTPIPSPTGAISHIYTGIDPWQTYEEDNIPGVGKAYANVGRNGNLVLVADDDVDQANEGVELAFRRAYNSQSRHDYLGSDGSNPSNFGNGWTNTFDAHIAVIGNPSAPTGLSVYDIDGARYDYYPNGSGGWTPPAGQHSLLGTPNSTNYLWEKPNGSIYQFYAPVAAEGAYAGKIQLLYGRDYYTALSFSYSWDSGSTPSASTLNMMSVTTQSGVTLNLTFANFSGRRLLDHITYPDGKTTAAAFGYNSDGNLTRVDDPPNNISSSACLETPRCLPQIYAYYGSGSLLNGVVDPRAAISYYQGVQDPRYAAVMGQVVDFTYDNNNVYNGTNVLQTMFHDGVVNFTPQDGTSTVLQSGTTGGSIFKTATFDHSTAMQTHWTDTDGHSTVYVFDSLDRVTSRGDWTGSQTLTSSQTWDSENNVTASIDVRGNETDYAFDANGDELGAALPSVVDASGNMYRPMTTFTYDSYFNVLTACGAEVNKDANRSWPNNISCPPSNSTQLAWMSSAYDEFGELKSITMPLGYKRVFVYDTSQGEDYGLPATVTGTTASGQAITQADGSTRSPKLTLTYDKYGDILTSNDGVGTTTYKYTDSGLGDGSLRLTAVVDADNVTTSRSFYSNGQIATSQSAAESAFNASSTLTYDANGNKATESSFHGCTSSPCSANLDVYWYDGADRVVEVQKPNDASDYYPRAWSTRDIYDLTEGQNVALNGTSYRAYGGLYKAQEYLPARTATWTEKAPTYIGPFSWIDATGTATDALDRKIDSYRIPNSGSGTTVHSYAYDGTGEASLLTSDCTELNQCTYYAYDADARTISTTHSTSGGLASSPDFQYSYDADNNKVTVGSSSTGTRRYTFDSEQHLLQTIEDPSWNSPATITNTYYVDGLPSGTGATSNALNAPALIQRSFSVNGTPKDTAVNLASAMFDGSSTQISAAFTMNYFYTPAKRFAGRSESSTNASVVTSEPPSSLNYDQYGRENSFVVADGSYAFTFDAEGRPTLISGTPRLNNGVGMYGLQSSYTSRDEMLVMGAERYANGLGISARASISGSTDPPASTLFDTVTGAALNVMPPTTTCNSLCVDPPPTGFSYDAALRQTTQVTSGSSSSAMITRNYDTDNHTVSEQFQQIPAGRFSCQTGSSAYTWGQFEHPYVVSASAAVFGSNVCSQSTTAAPAGDEILHWDGDSLLFTNAGNLDDIKIDDDADITLVASGKSPHPYVTSTVSIPLVTFWDRGLDGTIVGCHNQGGYGPGPVYAIGSGEAYQPGLSANPTCSSSNTTTDSEPPLAMPGAFQVGSGGIFYQPKSDGYYDGFNTLQGVRMMDSVTGSFTSPDAYAGDVANPASKKPFIWDGNNPEVFSDPSGFIPEYESEELAGMRGLAELDTSQNKLIQSGASRDEAAKMLNADPVAKLVQDVDKIQSAGRNVELPGTASEATSNEAGKRFVGSGAKLTKDGKGLSSSDGSRVYRFPAQKKDGKTGSNFESFDSKGKKSLNVHVIISK